MIRGSIAAIVTPMNAAGEVDEQGLARLVDLHLHEGSDALLVAGPRRTLQPDPAGGGTGPGRDPGERRQQWLLHRRDLLGVMP